MEHNTQLGSVAWLMLIQLAMYVVAMEADTCAIGDVASIPGSDAAWRESVVAKYSNMFEPPGMPAVCDTIHHIKLKPGSVLWFRW